MRGFFGVPSGTGLCGGAHDLPGQKTCAFRFCKAYRNLLSAEYIWWDGVACFRLFHGPAGAVSRDTMAWPDGAEGEILSALCLAVYSCGGGADGQAFGGFDFASNPEAGGYDDKGKKKKGNGGLFRAWFFDSAALFRQKCNSFRLACLSIYSRWPVFLWF